MTTSTRKDGGRRFTYFYSTALSCYISDCGNCRRRNFSDSESQAAGFVELHRHCFDFNFI